MDKSANSNNESGVAESRPDPIASVKHRSGLRHLNAFQFYLAENSKKKVDAKWWNLLLTAFL